ncbi:glycerophosphodiester phosphodiesterase family protein [Aliivibrio wodanis]|uniref:glycerophosphodiester phosphodiesterase family protein n=1 Tax=Aliivibrio wodanis TaxID=80852 RepID=UPI00406C7451
MSKFFNSILKRWNKIIEFNRVMTDIPLGDILYKIGESKYGEAYSVIAHGGGGTLNSNTVASLYTNSKSAILDSISDGKKLIELDLAVTSDGHIVAVHSWSEIKAIIGYNGIDRQVLHNEEPLTYSEVKNIDLGNGAIPLCINEINEIFSENKDLILVTDKIREISLLVNSFNYLERVIVEVFDKKSYELSYSLGINNVVFNIDIRKRKIVDWVLKNNIKAVSFSAREVNNHCRSYENAINLMNCGIISLAYSSSEDKFIESNLNKTMSAFYTDYWSLKNKKCTIQGGNITY